MNWIFAAILSAATFGLVSIIDSHLLSRRLPGLKSYLLPVGIIFLLASFVFFILYPFPSGLDFLSVLAAVGGGIFRTSGVLITLYNLKNEEVSRVMPITHIYPVFVAIMAIPLFRESLSYLQWLAIFIVVGGAVIISAEKKPEGSKTSLSRPFLMLFVAALLLAMSDVSTKYALISLPFWNMYAIAIFCMAVLFIATSISPGTFRQLKGIERKTSAFSWLVFNEIMALAAAVLQIWAISAGPIALVSTTLSTRPVFIAVYSIILSLIVPGFILRRISNRGMALRFVAIIMIVSGISIIYIT